MVTTPSLRWFWILAVTLPAWSGCGLVNVQAEVNGEPLFEPPPSSSAPHPPKSTPKQPPGTAPAAPAPPARQFGAATSGVDPRVPDYRWAEREAESQQAAEADPLAQGRTISAQLDALATRAATIRSLDSVDAYLAVHQIHMGLLMGLVWSESSEGAAFRQAITEEERATFDARVERAFDEGTRLEAMMPKGGGGGGPPSGTQTSDTGSWADEDAARRNQRLSSCERSCPSPYGSGDEWAASNQAYAQCRNEIASCRMGC